MEGGSNKANTNAIVADFKRGGFPIRKDGTMKSSVGEARQLYVHDESVSTTSRQQTRKHWKARFCRS